MINVGTFLFLLTYIVYLFIPELRLSQLWNPPSSLLIGKFERMDLQQSHVILNLASTLKTVLLPIFMIKLYVWKLRGKIVRGLSFILLWLYLEYLSILYIGRYEMVVAMIFIVFIFMTTRTHLKSIYNDRCGIGFFTVARILSIL